jgi:hypothetical protein
MPSVLTDRADGSRTTTAASPIDADHTIVAQALTPAMTTPPGVVVEGFAVSVL